MQSFNFLSLSSGSNGLKVDNSYDKIGTRLEALSKLKVPYFQSLPQQHGLMSIPTPNSQYASASYLDQLSVPGPQVLIFLYCKSTINQNKMDPEIWGQTLKR